MSAPRPRRYAEAAYGHLRPVISQERSVAGLGAKLKSARERRGISVRGLARSVSVSPSLVSQIEHGTVMPSVGTLYAMVNALDLGLDDLFRTRAKAAAGNHTTTQGEEHNEPVCRGSNRRTIRLAGGVRWELLTPAPDPELEFLYVVYEKGAESCAPDSLVRHGGMEYAYIISGRLGVRIGFNEYELRAGDSISFDAQSPHRLWAVGSAPAVAIWAVLNRHGDARAKLRNWNGKTRVGRATQQSARGAISKRGKRVSTKQR
jgi:transcriptional regulator with XRE-family HTH domain